MYFKINNTASTHIRGVIFFALPATAFSTTKEITPNEIPSEIEYMAADTSGRIHFAGKADERIELDFGPLPAGIYIIRANSSTFKFIKR